MKFEKEIRYFSKMKQPANTSIYNIGRLDWSIYECISNNFLTDQVIITEKQLLHIKERHPEAYDDTIQYLQEILESPDYIIKDKRPSTGLIIKTIVSAEKHIVLVLRICTINDKQGYKNSIITSWEISESRLQNYLNNKQILYKKE